MPPDRVVVLLVLPRHCRVRALRADELPAPQCDPDHDLVGLEADFLDPHPGQVQQAREYGSHAHGRRPPSSADLDNPRTYGLTSCASHPNPQTATIRTHPWALFAGIQPASDPLTQVASSPRSRGRNGPSQPRTAYTALSHRTKALLRPPIQALSHLRSSTEPPNSESGSPVAVPLRPAMRGKGVSAAVRRLPVRIGKLTVSRSALSASADDRAEIPVPQREQVPPTMVIGVRSDCSTPLSGSTGVDPP
jgi:hypothetical protein